MIKILVLFFVSLGVSAAVQAQPPSPGARLEKACMERMTGEVRRAAICKCLRGNLEKKTKPAEMNLLADTYENISGAEEKMQAEAFRALEEFDTEVSSKCTLNPSWKIAESKAKESPKSGERAKSMGLSPTKAKPVSSEKNTKKVD